MAFVSSSGDIDKLMVRQAATRMVRVAEDEEDEEDEEEAKKQEDEEQAKKQELALAEGHGS